jgi:hypothetical protein
MKGTRNGRTDWLRHAWIVALLALACGGSGGGAQAVGVGTARLAAACRAAACANIAKVTVTVSPGDGSTFQPITQELTNSGGQWSGRIALIPAGKGRLFDARALDASGNTLFSGSTKLDITAGAIATISVTLQGPDAPPLGNSFPVIDSVATSHDFVLPDGSAQVTITAHDPDQGDTLAYSWTANCGGTFDNPHAAQAMWTAPHNVGACALSYSVTDNHGAAVTGAIAILVSTAIGGGDVSVGVNSPPIVSSFNGTIQLGTTLQADLIVIATDPEGGALTYTWASTCPGINVSTQAPYDSTRPHLTLPGPSASCTVTVTVTDPLGAHASATLTLPPNQAAGGNKCSGVTCQSGQACDAATGACKPTDLCAGVTCTALDVCHVAGTCNPATGVCTTPAAANGTTCNDGNSCTQTDTCQNAICTGGNPVTCTGTATCNPSTGQCSGGTNLCANVTCTALDACHTVGVCDPSTGTCSNPLATNGTPCSDGNACTQTDTCQAGVCTGSNPVVCSGGSTCSPSTGQCGNGAAGPQVAKQLRISDFSGLAMDAAGASYVTGPIFQPTKNFDGINVTSVGDSDVLLAKYDPTTHNAVWAKAFGDASGQYPAGVAVTSDGTVAVIGNFLGSINSAPIALSNLGAAPIDFLIGLKSSDGSAKWGKSFNDGLGALIAIAANPNLNLIAVCGYADQAATDLVPGATAAGGTDIILAVFNSAGTLQWSKQLGSAADEECDALAIDDVGNVYAAGNYAGPGSLDLGTGPLPDPTSSFRKWLWIAKYSGTSGAALGAKSFGSGNGIHTPKRLAVDSTGKVVVAGSFTSMLPFGSTTLTSAGSGTTDAFVAKLDSAAAFAPVWAVRLGAAQSDEARGVALTSAGDVVVTGLFNGTTTGAATLTAASNAASDAFILKLAGNTGATLFSAAYGDVNTQNGNAVAVFHQGTGALQDLTVVGGGFAGTINFGGTAGSLSTTGLNDQQAWLVFGAF